MAKKFRAKISSDFEIVENGATVGWIRIKPSGVLWSPKGKHSWHGVAIDQFARFAKRKGKLLKK